MTCARGLNCQLSIINCQFLLLSPCIFQNIAYLCTRNRERLLTSRSGAVVARWAHNPKVVCSNQASATHQKEESRKVFFLFCFPPSRCAKREGRSSRPVPPVQNLKIINDHIDTERINFLLATSRCYRPCGQCKLLPSGWRTPAVRLLAQLRLRHRPSR